MGAGGEGPNEVVRSTAKGRPLRPPGGAHWEAIDPARQGGKALQKYSPNIVTYFNHRTSNASADGLEWHDQMVKEMACGFRNREHSESLYFHCGGLELYPEKI